MSKNLTFLFTLCASLSLSQGPNAFAHAPVAASSEALLRLKALGLLWPKALVAKEPRILKAADRNLIPSFDPATGSVKAAVTAEYMLAKLGIEIPPGGLERMAVLEKHWYFGPGAIVTLLLRHQQSADDLREFAQALKVYQFDAAFISEYARARVVMKSSAQSLENAFQQRGMIDYPARVASLRDLKAWPWLFGLQAKHCRMNLVIAKDNSGLDPDRDDLTHDD